MNSIKEYLKSENLKLTFFAIGMVAIALFVVLPLLPQADSVNEKALSLQSSIVAAFGGDGGGDGGGGGDAGGGCCGGDDSGDHQGGGNDITVSCALSASDKNVEVGDTVSIGRTISPTHGSFTLKENGTQVKKENTAEKGSVSNYYSKKYTSAGTYTYKGSYSKSGKSANCSVKVIVTEPPKPAPICTLVANPDEITKGGSSELKWTTQNAHSVSINQGIGGGLSLNGSRNVSPQNNITYTLTAVGDGGTKQCTEHIKVNEPEPDMPICTLVASKSVITKGESTTLTWTSSNGNTATLQGNSALLNGSQSISPTATTTYTFIVVGDGGTKTCTETVIVKEKPEEPAPVCNAFSATPSKFTNGIGGDVTLTWDTTNADSVSINQNVGTKGADGSTVTSVSTTTTFTLTAIKDGKTDTCTTKVVVEEKPEEPAPVCNAFSATPSKFTNGIGGDVTLTWDTTNADSVSINQGVGSQNVDGSATTSVSDDTTFTLTATGNGKTDTCTTKVVVEEPEDELSCDISASDTTVNRNTNVTLTWGTTGATDAEIDHSIGDVPLNGFEGVVITDDITFTLTAVNGSNQVQCSVSIDVSSGGGGGGGGSSSPRCDLEANKTRISRGEEVILSWDNTRTNDILLEDDRGNTLIDTDDNLDDDNEYDEDEDSYRVEPDRTTEYTLTALRGSRDDECTVEIEVVDDVSVSQTRTQPPLVAGISLSRVPYTGFEAGPFLTAVFYTLLTLWSLGVTYVLVIQRGSVFGFSLPRYANSAASGNSAATKPEQAYAFTPAPNREPIARSVAQPVQRAATQSAPFNLPTGSFTPVIGYQSMYDNQSNTMEEPVEENIAADVMTEMENRAHEARVLLSSDAMRYIIDHSDDHSERMALLDEVVERAKASYPREEGWVVINKERINELFSVTSQHDAVVMHEPEIEATVQRQVGGSSLAEAILSGNIQAAYQLLGDNPMLALADAATDLDAVFRSHKGEPEQISDMLARVAERISDEKLEAAVAAITSAIDGTYADERAAVKLAVMKAVKAIS